MELNREQIVKALECCKSKENQCKRCPYYKDETSPCFRQMLADALALIRELTEYVKRLEAEVSVKKKLLDKCEERFSSIKADTVRKMQEMLLDTKTKICNDYYIFADNVEVIASKLLEEGK